MILFAKLIALIALILPVLSPLAEPDGPEGNACLYPSLHERFGITVGGRLERYDVSPLPVGGYLNWAATIDPAHPNGMDYYPTVYVNDINPAFAPYGYWPNDRQLKWRVRANPGATWLVGNEADYRRHNDHATPEAYARIYHDVYYTIKALDPSAKIAANATATISTLRLTWWDRVWNAYQAMYGEEMPVDVWAVHSYVVNEMVHEWGPEFPPGIDNVVGFGDGDWMEESLPAASGGTVHSSNQPGARAYFAFVGDDVTLYLITGPDAGIADIYIDNQAAPVETVDLYSPTTDVITRQYGTLPVYTDPLLQRRHHVRVQVTGQRNPASTGTWVRVDAIEAESTAALAGGRLENSDPMRARILHTADEHDDLDAIVAEIRAMRQWMADHGQQHKPLINTEYGVLMGEDLGFDPQRVQDFMLNSFDLYVNDQGLVDPDIGLPEDGNRLLQQWFWFIVAMDYFNGSRVHTGLYDPATHEMLPLGQAYADYVQNLVSSYTDLETTYLTVTPSWPLFAGEPSLVQIRSGVHNRGNTPVNPFWVRLSEGTSTIEQWHVPGLSADNGGNHTFDIEYQWEPVITGDHQLTLTADSTGIVDEPCDPNNSITTRLEARPYTDLALSNLRIDPPFIDHRTTTLDVRVDLANLGSLGTAADQVVVNFWEGNPDGAGTLLYSQTLLPGRNLRVTTVRFAWEGFTPGRHELVAEVVPVPEETALDNNRLAMTVTVPKGDYFRFFPIGAHSGLSAQAASAAPYWQTAADKLRQYFMLDRAPATTNIISAAGNAALSPPPSGRQVTIP